MRTSAVLIGCFGISLLCLTALKTTDDGPSPALTPEQERATFQLEPDLDIQLVAAEPMVQDPVVIQFDPDGRLWVVEMRGFMPTVDGQGEKQRVGRVSVLEDADGDGRMDRSTVYLDSLILPRALALVPGGALVAENNALWMTEDRNGDLRADSKTLIDPDYAGNGLPEHAGNGLWRGVDNWYYNAKSRFRYKLVGGSWKRDSTEFRGQWGLSHDDKGRLLYNYNWSQLHGDLVPPNYLFRNKNHTPTTGIDHGLTVDRRIYPIRPTPAVNRGYIPGTLDKAGKLLEFTAACSPLAYRGKALPAAYHGNIFVCEPAGNLVKRNVVEEKGPILAASDPHPGREFLASTDERFRPVHLTEGPDGALYVADMYRGIVQHSAYMTPYLKEQSVSRNLVLPIHRGRIWRIVPKNGRAERSAKLSAESSSQLVARLSHPDGWHRDASQRLLVERGDKTVRPALLQTVREGRSELGRFHALWTLEGLQQLQPVELFPLLTDASPLIRTTALRLLEPFAARDPAVRERLGQLLLTESPKAAEEVAIQMAFTANGLSPAVANPVLENLLHRHGSLPLVRDAALSSLQNRELAFLQYLWKSPRWQTAEPAKEIFLEMLTTAIVRGRKASDLAALSAMAKSTKAPDWRQVALKNGLSVRGETAETAQAAKKTALSGADQEQFALGRQHYLTTCSGCHGTNGGGLNRFAPPLTGSDWVMGDEKRLTLLVLHGMEGPVEVAGKRYDAPAILPVMPAHTTMDDAVIASILTYIRNAWGNSAPPVSRRTVGMTRITSQGRVMPWKAAELNEYVLQAKK
ncbi:DUF7133 domain-containing protein [Tellurirhabdus rosea]|uniref:DUF7133 domain-containing protein n=1 Tax=Tellurirhabdus rosea TaxID=2674997 RepID=UPI002259AEBF|nr:c-type cytochrome [Tellurirhabdus rosea]